eukprot:scaffold53198_cov27-Prasinocladus_malaysianus.AAC.9
MPRLEIRRFTSIGWAHPPASRGLAAWTTPVLKPCVRSPPVSVSELPFPLLPDLLRLRPIWRHFASCASYGATSHCTIAAVSYCLWLPGAA